GDDPDAPHMRAARDAVIALGGAERINTFSMFYLACLGQVSWDACPAIPPEIALLPRWFPFHMDKVAAWTRTMILPLALCSALRPVRAIPEHLRIDELFIDPDSRHRLNQPWNREESICWTNFFLAVDRALKIFQKSRLIPTRRRAIRVAEEWLLDRLRPETTDGLGAIFPPMVYIQVALQALGYERNHPVRAVAERELDRFIVEESDHIRIQPCFSPVWDTGIALYAITEAGLTTESEPRIAKTCDWLCDRAVSLVGDWVRNLRPADRARFRDSSDWSAWAFEYRNDWYPDVDDTAMVAKAMRRAAGPGPDGDRARDAAERAVHWILAMQNDDGGWAAFDRTKDRPWMEAVPFADHNAMQDPSCPDITGRTVESLVTCGVPTDHPAIRTAVDYLLAHQAPEGWWPGRWGVNAVYGAWQAVGGLVYAGLTPDHPSLRRVAAWLKSVQNTDGGFGETADSYIDPALCGSGPSTASQTAWGLLTLLQLLPPTDAAIRRAVAYLCSTQLTTSVSPETPHEIRAADDPHNPDGWTPHWQGVAPTDRVFRVSHPVPEPAGAWREPWFTGTGFPKVFYLRYHYYRLYFPLMALAQYRTATGSSEVPAIGTSNGQETV
ncbi:MAG: squalene--hopene cyclase, partial [Planctomycetota bacterium]|nr:squalene--hopene cyclase [Planctomycetota bacterium]